MSSKSIQDTNDEKCIRIQYLINVLLKYHHVCWYNDVHDADDPCEWFKTNISTDYTNYCGNWGETHVIRWS